MKKLLCTKCKKLVVEVVKGKVKKDVVVYCGQCGAARGFTDIAKAFERFTENPFKGFSI